VASTAQDTRKGPLEIGDRFTKFEIRGLLGKGGHAWVYHGYDQFLDRSVAIKLIPNPAEPGRNLGERAKQEARILCKLEHPNIVRVIDAGATDSGIVYIVMEILEGRTLREVLHEFHSLSVSEVLSLGIQIADGVQAAHELNAIHRDLKPENVFLLKGNALKVLDFGIAKFLGYGVDTTQKDLIHGTMLYMSPEHLQGFVVTPRSDIYGLGTILYELLAGRAPCMIDVPVPTMQALAYSQVFRMPPPLDELTKTVPRFVARTIQRMLAKNPSERFASMTEVGEQLRLNLQRYAEESRGAAQTTRKLWCADDSVPPLTSVARMTHATTEIHEPVPSSAMAAGSSMRQSGDTAPFSDLPFSTENQSPLIASPPSSVERAAATLLSAPNGALAMGAVPNAVGSHLGSTVPAVPDAKNKAAPRNAGASVVPAQAAQVSLPSAQQKAASGKRVAAWQVAAAAIVVGVGAGLVIGVVGQSRPSKALPSLTPSSLTDEPIAARPTSAVPPSQPPAAAVQEPVVGVSDTAAPTPVAVPPATTSATPSSKPLASSSAPLPAPSNPAGHGVASSKLPGSGLWDMSNLDTPTKAKPVAAAPAKPKPKAFFGADEIK
jgi:serine/threonine protein kinase